MPFSLLRTTHAFLVFQAPTSHDKRQFGSRVLAVRAAKFCSTIGRQMLRASSAMKVRRPANYVCKPRRKPPDAYEATPPEEVTLEQWRRAVGLVSMGLLHKACSALVKPALAAPTPAMLEEVRAKHPEPDGVPVGVPPPGTWCRGARRRRPSSADRHPFISE